MFIVKIKTFERLKGMYKASYQIGNTKSETLSVKNKTGTFKSKHSPYDITQLHILLTTRSQLNRIRKRQADDPNVILI